MRDEYDDDDEISIRREISLPASVRTAGIIWIAMGGLSLVNAALNLAITVSTAATPGGGPQAAGGMCGVVLAAVFGAAFIFVGVQTTRGTAQDTLGNAIGSIIFGLLNGGSGLVVMIGGAALGRGLGVLMIVLGVVSMMAGVALLVAGILALIGRDDYKAWRRASSRRRQ